MNLFKKIKKNQNKVLFSHEEPDFSLEKENNAIKEEISRLFDHEIIGKNQENENLVDFLIFLSKT